MYIEPENLIPGAAYQYKGEDVVFEGAGMETNDWGESLAFRKVQKPKSFVMLEAPEVERSKFELSDWRRKVHTEYGSAIFRQPKLSRNVYVGSDPEFFVVYQDKEFIPAFDLYPAKKEYKDLFWDGFQGEFRTEATYCVALHTGNVKEMLENAMLTAQKVTVGEIKGFEPVSKQLKVSVLPSSVVELSSGKLQYAKDEHVALGCDPSRNVYGMSGIVPDDPRKLQYRFAGGHVHIGFEHPFLHDGMFEEAVRCADMLVGIPSVVMAQGWDKEIRRKFYGLPGEWRRPKHGMEYRTLSNFWLREPAMAQLFVGLVRGAFNWGMNGWRMFFPEDLERTLEIVIESDVRGARKWLWENKGMYLEFLKFARISHPEKTFRVFTEQIDYDHQKSMGKWRLFGSGVTTWQTRVSALADVPVVER